MSAWWPVLQARLVEILPALATGFDVYDGPRSGKETGDKKYVLVGVSSEGESGSYEATDSSADTLWDDAGAVVCEVVSWSGDPAPAHRAAVFAVANAIEAAVRADQRLGVLPVGSTLRFSGRPVHYSNGFGLVLTFSYFVRS